MKQCIKCTNFKDLADFKLINSTKKLNTTCIECVRKYAREYRKNYYQQNKEQEKLKALLYQKLNPDKHLKKVKKWQKNNPDKVKAYNRSESSIRSRKKYESKPIVRITKNIRRRLRHVLKNAKKSSFSKYIGCSIQELKNHLEKQFQPGMTWENYGKWYIDHIIPLSSANNSVEQIYKLQHYTNLQPLWAIDNIKKGKKLEWL